MPACRPASGASSAATRPAAHRFPYSGVTPVAGQVTGVVPVGGIDRLDRPEVSQIRTRSGTLRAPTAPRETLIEGAAEPNYLIAAGIQLGNFVIVSTSSSGGGSGVPWALAWAAKSRKVSGRTGP